MNGPFNGNFQLHIITSSLSDFSTHPDTLVEVGPDDLALGAALLHEPAVLSVLCVGDADLQERTLQRGLVSIDPGRCNL